MYAMHKVFSTKKNPKKTQILLGWLHKNDVVSFWIALDNANGDNLSIEQIYLWTEASRLIFLFRLQFALYCFALCFFNGQQTIASPYKNQRRFRLWNSETLQSYLW